jgi:AcrR family transcriptional regulator
VATQAERKDETRALLLSAAAAVFAERGVEGASVDAIAEAAGRTSGALYSHFGSKEGLLIELLESWRSEVSAAILVDLSDARTVDERLLALWHEFAHAKGPARQWVQLEHELWRWATRAQANELGNVIAARYRTAREAMTALFDEWALEGLIPAPRVGAGAAVIGLLIGLEMQHRLDRAAVTDAVALAGLRALLVTMTAGGRSGTRSSPSRPT